jgi:CubicO group peptidase (beta-lactamase class C family)
VTLRQLLTHTSETWPSGPEDLPEWRHCDVDLSEAVRRIREHGFEPTQTHGGQFHYSANALQIAAHLISQAMSTNFLDLMDWYLFEHLGLTDGSMWCRRNPSSGGGVKASPAEYVDFPDA